MRRMTMHKYILTEKNIDDMAGRIRKFFDSCSDCGIYCTINNVEQLLYFYWAGDTSHKDVSVSTNHVTCKPIISIKYPVVTYIELGDVIYIYGGGKIYFKDHSTGNDINITLERDYTRNHAAVLKKLFG